MCSTGVMKSAWACRSAGIAMQSIYVAARTIATQNRRCENQSSSLSSLLTTKGTQDSKALVKTKSEREEFATTSRATES